MAKLYEVKARLDNFGEKIMYSMIIAENEISKETPKQYQIIGRSHRSRIDKSDIRCILQDFNDTYRNISAHMFVLEGDVEFAKKVLDEHISKVANNIRNTAEQMYEGAMSGYQVTVRHDE